MKNIRLKLVVPLLLLLSSALYAENITQDFLPSALLQLDNYFSHHVLIAEKSTHQLHLFSHSEGVPKYLGPIQMATGKKAGDKIFQGDHRTPEGVYFFVDFLTHQDLINRHGKAGEIYGVGAFVMNYPNPMDQREGKTGGGIWLHSTNDETRIEKGLDSRGCIVTANSKLIDVSKYIELNRTPIVVVHDLKFLSKDSWLNIRNNAKSIIQDWANAWQSEDLERYLSHYHKTQYKDNFRGSFKEFKQYKQAIFAKNGSPEVVIDNLSLLAGKDYIVANFTQSYKSNTIEDLGKKTLYLVRDEYYNWKIVSENWTKAGIDESSSTQVAFQPSMRFFPTNDPAQILGQQENKSSKN